MAQSLPLQSSLVVDDESALENVFGIGTQQPPVAAKINLNLEPVLKVIDSILSCANKSIKDALAGKCEGNILTSQSVQAGSFAASIGPLASVINKLSCELQCKCSGGDSNKSTTVILEMLQNYTCGAKAVIAIAALALKYGDFCLYAQLYLGHPLARYLGILKLLPDIAEHGYTLQHLFVLIGVIVELAKVMVQLEDLNHEHFSEDIPPLEVAMSMIDNSATLVILSVVVCTEQIASLAGVSTEETTLSSVAEKTEEANQLLIFMQKNLRKSQKILDQRKRKENCEKVKRDLDKAKSLEEVLDNIFNWDESTLIRCDGLKGKVEKKVLLDKRVLILISDLDISEVEITGLREFYEKWQMERKTEQQTEIVWLPVIETGTAWEKCMTKVKEVRRSMPWYTIEQPWSIKEEVFSYIKQEWHFSRKTSLVALDSRGKVQSTNVLDMLWMWGQSISDFSLIGEFELWKKYNTVFELIFGRTGYTIDFNAVNNGTKIVCFYGGEDIEWIKKFTALARKAAVTKGSTIDLIYVGKSFHLDKVKENIKVINQVRISQTWTWTTISQFWTSLKSILYSSTKITNDIKITSLQEITSLLTLDGNDNGWAVFCGKSGRLIKVRGEDAVTFLEKWAPKGANLDLVSEIEIKFPIDKNHCHHFFVHQKIQEDVQCYCGQTMERSYVYKCCHGLH